MTIERQLIQRVKVVKSIRKCQKNLKHVIFFSP